MRRAFYIFALVLIGGLLFSGTAHDAYAYTSDPGPMSKGSNGELGARYENGRIRTCSDYNDSTGGVFKAAVFGTVIPCISDTVQDSAEAMVAEMVYFMRPIFYAFLTLVLIFHGITAAQGEGQIGPRTFLLLLKISAVITFVESLAGPGIGPVNVSDVYAIMHGTEDVMARAMLPGGVSEFQCDISQYLPSNRPGHLLWAEMDCALSKVIGFTAGTDGKPSMALAASVLGMLSGFFFGGTIGLAVFFAAVGFIISILMFVVRVGFSYVNAYMVAALYIIIAPIFIPLVLMRPTTQYFNNWVKGLLGAMITPVVVTAYSMFALLIFDHMMFRDDSIFNTLFQYKYLESAQRDVKYGSLGTVVNDQLGYYEREKVGDQANAGADAINNRDPGFAALTSATNIRVPMPNLEITRAKLQGLTDNEAADEKRLFTEFMIEFAKLFILGFIVISGWKEISAILVVLTGSGVAPMTLNPLSPAERGVMNASSQAKQAMKETMGGPAKDGELVGPGGAMGATFIERLVPTMGAGAQTFLGGVGR